MISALAHHTSRIFKEISRYSVRGFLITSRFERMS